MTRPRPPQELCSNSVRSPGQLTLEVGAMWRCHTLGISKRGFGGVQSCTTHPAPSVKGTLNVVCIVNVVVYVVNVVS